MSIESAIEQRIREAMARGEFDDLPGKGKPLDLTDYFNTPKRLRMGFSILRSNQFVPEEVEIIKEIAALNEQIQSESDEALRAAFTGKKNEKKLRLSLLLDDRRRRFARLT